ncbi:MAG: UDP-N-acetylglucosamine 2-epimerase [Planctomycetota bacterium]
MGLTRESRMSSGPRNVCFVTGTRAEYGLMRTTLAAIGSHPDLRLRVLATGMHLDRSRGHSIDQIPQVDHVTPWSSDGATARNTGAAIADMADAFDGLETEIVLVVGDRVEAFAGASAAAIGGRLVAHVHGGDRALGQLDDALRHAITKLAHVHFAATPGSAERIRRLGEEHARVHVVGAPGINGIADDAIDPGIDGDFALLVYHPARADEDAEAAVMRRLLDETCNAFQTVVAIYPNNDPGSAGIASVLDADDRPGLIKFRDVPRPRFLGLMRDARVMVGNSSSGIIEAASFGTPVIDVGPRQSGREHSANVTHVTTDRVAMTLRDVRPWAGTNVYGGDGTGARIADLLADLPRDPAWRRKLITY